MALIYIGYVTIAFLVLFGVYVVTMVLRNEEASLKGFLKYIWALLLLLPF